MRTRRFVALATSLVLAAFAASWEVPPAQAAPTVRFVKVYFDSPGTDSGSNASLNAEWARIKNFGSSRRTLTGWRVRDASGHVFVFPRFTLGAGATVTVHTGSGSNTGANLYWNAGNYIWNNSGDTATLKNSGGTTIDTCRFSGAGSAAAC